MAASPGQNDIERGPGLFFAPSMDSLWRLRVHGVCVTSHVPWGTIAPVSSQSSTAIMSRLMFMRHRFFQCLFPMSKKNQRRRCEISPSCRRPPAGWRQFSPQQFDRVFSLVVVIVAQFTQHPAPALPPTSRIAPLGNRSAFMGLEEFHDVAGDYFRLPTPQPPRCLSF